MGRKREVFPPLSCVWDIIRHHRGHGPPFTCTVDGPVIFDDPSCLMSSSSSSVSHHLDCLCMHRPGPKPGSTNHQSPTLSSLSLYLERSTTGFFGPHNFHFQILPASGRAQHSVCLSVCLRRRREIWTASLSSASRGEGCGGFQHLEPAPSAAVIGPDESRGSKHRWRF